MIDNFTNDVNAPTTYHRKYNIYKVSQEHVCQRKFSGQHICTVKCNNITREVCVLKWSYLVPILIILDPISLYMPFSL